MKKIIISLNTIIILLIVTFNLFASSNIFLKDTIYIKNAKIYYSNNILYVINKNYLYQYNDRKLSKIIKLNIYNKVKSVKHNANQIIITTINQIIILSKLNHKILWEKYISGKIYASVITSDSIIIDKNAGLIIAFNLITGKQLWRNQILMENFIIFTNSKLFKHNNYIIYIYAPKQIILFNKITGKKIKSIYLYHISQIKSLGVENHNFKIKKALIYKNIMFICNTSGDLIIFDLIKKKIHWQVTNMQYTDCNNFFIIKKNLIILKNNGIIVCLNKYTGKKQWENTLFKNKNNVKINIIKKMQMIILCYKKHIYIIQLRSGQLILQKNLHINIDEIIINNSKNIIYIKTKNKIKIMQII